jgi:hypothetical protein
MSKDETRDLLKFLKPFPHEVQQRALWLRDFAWDLYPEANELIYDNYNALAFGWSPTLRVGDTFCSVAVGRTSHNVHFGFYWGSKLTDTKKILLGEGNQYRYVLVENPDAFPKSYMKKLMAQAYAYSLKKVKDKSEIQQGTTVTKSVSDAKRSSAKRRTRSKG